jgi:hypothetical protein
MYGIFTYIWVFFGQMLVNIPDMENMGICINTIKIVHIIYHIEKISSGISSISYSNYINISHQKLSFGAYAGR